MSQDSRTASELRAFVKGLPSWVRLVHEDKYLAHKSRDLRDITRAALSLTALMSMSMLLWDVAVDPARAPDVIWLRVLQCVTFALWAILSWTDVRRTAARVGMFLAPVTVMVLFGEVMSRLDQGTVYGSTGIVYLLTFLTFLCVAQPMIATVALVTCVACVPPLAAFLNIGPSMNWRIYGASMVLTVGSACLLIILTEYFLWRVYRYRLKIEELAQRDSLTGILNRHQFLIRAGRVFERLRRYDHALSLLFIDLDRFKAINDQYGHAAGDQVLRHVVAILSPMFRASDIFARYGGEEFVVLLPETEGEAARALAERVCSAVAESRIILDDTAMHSIGLTLSIGIADCRLDTRSTIDIEALIKRADRALYNAKSGGRNRVAQDVGDPDPERRSVSNMTV